MSRTITIGCCCVVLVLLVAPGVAGAARYTMEVAPSRPDGVFNQGEDVSFRIMVRRDGRPLAGQQISYTITKSDGAQAASGAGEIAGKPVIAKAKVDGPAIIRCEARYSSGNITDEALAVAVVAPELFRPAMPPPEDFDAFWQAQRQLLASMPAVETGVQPAQPPADADPLLKQAFNAVAVFDVQAPTVEGVAPLRGLMARPKVATPKSLPAILYPQAPGPRMAPVRPSPQEVLRATRGGGRPPAATLKGDPGRAITAAKAGMLALSFYLDDLPGAAAPPEAGGGPAGAADREGHFLRGAILRQMRAIEVLTRQPEWNGTVLVVQGDGVGGGLALAAAGLDPRVTLCVAGEPAMCDLAAPEPGRAGWPHAAPAGPPPDEQARQAARYFDAAHFAARIPCPTVFTIDYGDATAPPAGVLAAAAAVPDGQMKQLIRVERAEAERAKVQAQLDAIVRKHVSSAAARPAPPASAPPVRQPHPATPGRRPTP